MFYVEWFILGRRDTSFLFCLLVINPNPSNQEMERGPRDLHAESAHAWRPRGRTRQLDRTVPT